MVTAFRRRRPWVRRALGRCPGVRSGFGAVWARSDLAAPNRRDSVRRAGYG